MSIKHPVAPTHKCYGAALQLVPIRHRSHSLCLRNSTERAEGWMKCVRERTEILGGI